MQYRYLCTHLRVAHGGEGEVGYEEALVGPLSSGGRQLKLDAAHHSCVPLQPRDSATYLDLL
jgi:hypothetical protein